jgi:hypothetical protein
VNATGDKNSGLSFRPTSSPLNLSWFDENSHGGWFGAERRPESTQYGPGPVYEGQKRESVSNRWRDRYPEDAGRLNMTTIGAVDIGGTKIAVGMVDESGRLLAKVESPSPSDYLQGLQAITDMLRESARASEQGIPDRQGTLWGCSSLKNRCLEQSVKQYVCPPNSLIREQDRSIAEEQETRLGRPLRGPVLWAKPPRLSSHRRNLGASSLEREKFGFL